ncbi:hypothetical protein [Pseudomonas putida]|uniref:hypothetical protein n=1 Tax=Pseudomonas putida TaxID=303 RepID=UPI0015E18747|nr:hypothetical protein [Pseudomonas putida]
MSVEWVAGSSWNQWPDVYGIGGRMAVESARNGHLEALLEQELQLKCGPDHQHDEQQIQELREALQNLQASLLQTQAELLGLYREQSRSTGKAR